MIAAFTVILILVTSLRNAGTLLLQLLLLLIPLLLLLKLLLILLLLLLQIHKWRHAAILLKSKETLHPKKINFKKKTHSTGLLLYVCSVFSFLSSSVYSCLLHSICQSALHLSLQLPFRHCDLSTLSNSCCYSSCRPTCQTMKYTAHYLYTTTVRHFHRSSNTSTTWQPDRVYQVSEQCAQRPKYTTATQLLTMPMSLCNSTPCTSG